MVAFKSYFSNLLLQGLRRGQLPGKTEEARKWYRDRAKKLTVPAHTLMSEDRTRLKTRSSIGEMVHFFYDPKHKETLPYYDTFPLVFKLENYDDGFLGLNLHYLPLTYRAKLMDALHELTNNDRYDEKTRLKISYGILKSASKYKWFKPCIKRYLYSHVRSRFMSIHPSEWDIVLMLPSEAFQKATKSTVWKDSRGKF